ncbi:MAG TPA: hypothetical protein VGE45_03235 [Chloroflexia bacterium]|jgi:hypothetical protein
MADDRFTLGQMSLEDVQQLIISHIHELVASAKSTHDIHHALDSRGWEKKAASVYADLADARHYLSLSVEELRDLRTDIRNRILSQRELERNLPTEGLDEFPLDEIWDDDIELPEEIEGENAALLSAGIAASTRAYKWSGASTLAVQASVPRGKPLLPWTRPPYNWYNPSGRRKSLIYSVKMDRGASVLDAKGNPIARVKRSTVNIQLGTIIGNRPYTWNQLTIAQQTRYERNFKKYKRLVRETKLKVKNETDQVKKAALTRRLQGYRKQLAKYTPASAGFINPSQIRSSQQNIKKLERLPNLPASVKRKIRAAKEKGSRIILLTPREIMRVARANVEPPLAAIPADGPQFDVTAERIPKELYHYGFTGNKLDPNKEYSFSPFSRNLKDGVGLVMLINTPDQPHGGAVRTVINAGETFVQGAEDPSGDPAGSTTHVDTIDYTAPGYHTVIVNGQEVQKVTLTWAYGCVVQGGLPVYGWVLQNFTGYGAGGVEVVNTNLLTPKT